MVHFADWTSWLMTRKVRQAPVSEQQRLLINDPLPLIGLCSQQLAGRSKPVSFQTERNVWQRRLGDAEKVAPKIYLPDET
jgi:hypothetical protein